MALCNLEARYCNSVKENVAVAVFKEELGARLSKMLVECVWNVMAHAQKPDLVFRRNGRIHWNQRGRHFSRLLAAEVCTSAVVMLDTPCSEVVWEYWLPNPFASFPSLPLPCVTVFHQVSNALYQTRRCDTVEDSNRQYIVHVKNPVGTNLPSLRPYTYDRRPYDRTAKACHCTPFWATYIQIWQHNLCISSLFWGSLIVTDTHASERAVVYTHAHAWTP